MNKRFCLIILLILTIPFYAEAATISSGGGHQIQDEGVDLPARTYLDLTGDGISCSNVDASTTECNVGQSAIPEPNYYVAGYNADGELINYSTGISTTLYFYPNSVTFTNVDFETDVTGWTCNSCGVAPQVSTTVYVTGAKSMFFDANGASAIVEEAITVIPETPYTISAWVYDSDATNTIDLRIRDTSYTGGASLCSASTTAAWAGGWVRLTCSTPATNTDTSLYVQIVTNEDATNIYVDDFQLSIQDVTPSTVKLQDDGFVHCKISNCVAFDGAQTNINTADSASLEPTTGLTLSAWVFPTSEKTGVIIEKGSGTQYSLEVISDTYYDSKVKFKLTNNSSGISQTTTNAYYIYQWTHVVAQISGTAGTGADDTVYFYINGTLVDTITGQNYQMPAHATGIYIGASTVIPGFRGYMDDVRVYSAAISSADITAMYNAGNGTACTGSETSIVACWNLNETSGTTAVSLPAGFNGTLASSTGSNISGWRNCKLSNCIQFDGVDDYVEVKHSPAMDFTDNFSFSFWLYRGVDTGSNEVIFSMSDVDAPTIVKDYSILSRINVSDKLEIYIAKRGGANAYLTGTTSIAVGQWYHVVLTKSSTAFQIYLNNVSDGSGLTGGVMRSVIINNYPLLFGAWGSYGSTTYGFQGKIDEFQMYNTVLGTSEISALYNSGSGAACTGSETGLVACWHFNETSGQIAYQVKNQTGIGSDSNDCITSSTPCKTLQAVINKIPQYYAGTAVVNIASVSMFPENPVINGYNNSGNYTITLRGYNNPTPNQFTDVATLSGTSTGSNTANFPKDTLSLFNDTSIDATADNGTLTNSPTWLDGSPSAECGPATNQDGCVSFDQTTPAEYITMGDVSQAEGLSQLSVLFWIKGLAANSDSYAGLVTKGNDGDATSSWRIQKASTNSTVRFNLTNTTPTTYSYITTSTVLDDTWHHVAAIYDGSVIRVYIDGTADATSPVSASGTIYNSACAVAIGAMNYAASCSGGDYETRAFTGTIDEVAIFKTALTQDQIRTNCGWTGSVCGGYFIPDTTAGLIALHHMEEGTGTTSYDTAQSSFSGNVQLGDLLYIDSGPGSGTWARVQSKQSGTQLAAITRWGTTPTSVSTYQIFPNKYLPKIHANNGTYGLQIKNSSGIGVDRLGIIKAASYNLYAEASKLDDVYRVFFNKSGYIGADIQALTTGDNIQFNFGEYNTGEAIRLIRSSTINNIANNHTRGGLCGVAGYWSSSMVGLSTNLFDIANYYAVDLEQNFTTYGLSYNRISRSGYGGMVIANNSNVTATAPNTITSNYGDGVFVSTFSGFSADFYGSLLLSDFEIKSNSKGLVGNNVTSCIAADRMGSVGSCNSFTYSGNTTDRYISSSDDLISSTAPTVSSCGTSPSANASSRTSSGSVTIGGGTVTSCTLTFPVTWAVTPFCIAISNNTGVTLATSTTTTALTITSSATMNGQIVKYNCGLN